MTILAYTTCAQSAMASMSRRSGRPFPAALSVALCLRGERQPWIGMRTGREACWTGGSQALWARNHWLSACRSEIRVLLRLLSPGGNSSHYASAPAWDLRRCPLKEGRGSGMLNSADGRRKPWGYLGAIVFTLAGCSEGSVLLGFSRLAARRSASAEVG